MLAQAWRYWLLKQEVVVFDVMMEKIGSWSITALLLTLVLLFRFQSGAALATVVGVLIEVPVMLTVVRIVNQSKNWCEST